MLQRIILFVCLLSSLHIDAQQLPGLKPLRYDEDYTSLKLDTTAGWYRKAKYTSLAKDGNTYVSFGGDIRVQYFNLKNEGWGEEPKDKDGFIFNRWLLHADLHTGKYFRTFVQLQSSMSNGKMGSSPVDEDPLEVHQAFVDINSFPSPKHKLVIRVGRQELSYGSQRLVSVREGPNNRQSFDGIKSMFSSGNYKLDLFYSNHVAAKKGLFDDGFNKNTRFWGSYLVFNKLPMLHNIDLYYLGLAKKNISFDDGSGKEIRHSIGSRIWQNKGHWQYDLEGLYQFGKFGASSIHAWTASINTTYELEQLKYSPTIGLKTEFISGDAIAGDGQLETFNPLFPRGGYFGLASLIGPANLIDIHPSLSFALTKKLDWNIDYDIFWRYSRNDGIYAPNASLIYSGKNNPAKKIGQQLSSELVYIPNMYWYFRAEFTWFKAGDFLKIAGPGKDILFTGLTMQVKF